jgi:hypothetical protein
LPRLFLSSLGLGIPYCFRHKCEAKKTDSEKNFVTIIKAGAFAGVFCGKDPTKSKKQTNTTIF